MRKKIINESPKNFFFFSKLTKFFKKVSKILFFLFSKLFNRVPVKTPTFPEDSLKESISFFTDVPMYVCMYENTRFKDIKTEGVTCGGSCRYTYTEGREIIEIIEIRNL
jgi:hypothetical protein